MTGENLDLDQRLVALETRLHLKPSVREAGPLWRQASVGLAATIISGLTLQQAPLADSVVAGTSDKTPLVAIRATATVIAVFLVVGLAQAQLAKRVGTSHSAISRIESGQHAATPETLRKLATALDMRLVIGFERGPKKTPKRDLIVFG